MKKTRIEKGVNTQGMDQEEITDLLFIRHTAFAEKHSMEFYNVGWCQGDDFIHSKTDKGRLYTELHEDVIIHTIE